MRLLTARGVKPREMIERMRVCCGASMFSMITRCMSMFSRSMFSLNRMIAPFSQDEKIPSLRETSLTSACRVSTQWPVVVEAVAVPRLRLPPHRRGAAQFLPLLARQARGVHVRIVDVETLGELGLCHGRPPG